MFDVFCDADDDGIFLLWMISTTHTIGASTDDVSKHMLIHACVRTVQCHNFIIITSIKQQLLLFFMLL